MEMFYDLFRFLQALAEAKLGEKKNPQIPGARQVYVHQMKTVWSLPGLGKDAGMVHPCWSSGYVVMDYSIYIWNKIHDQTKF